MLERKIKVRLGLSPLGNIPKVVCAIAAFVINKNMLSTIIARILCVLEYIFMLIELSKYNWALLRLTDRACRSTGISIPSARYR